MNRVRVLRLIARMNVGGPALQVAGLLRDLDPTVFEQLLVTGSVEDGEADLLDLRGVDLPIRRIPELGRSVHAADDLRAFRSVTRVARRFDPHIVHTHTAKAGVLGRFAAEVCRIPHRVHTFHGHLLHGYFGRMGTAAVKATESLLARRTDRLFSVGSKVRDELLAAGVGRPNQYVVMPPGVIEPHAHEKSEARKRLGIEEDRRVVAFVARLTHVKRPDRFLDVARQIAAVDDSITFLVAGEGPLLETVRRDASELEDQIRFLGWVSDVGEVYAASDLVLLTSDNEGMPVSLIEAAMCGVPAVATDVGSVREVVEDGRTGFVHSRDVGRLSDAALRLLRDEGLRETFGHAARQRARSRFSVERLVADTADAYLQLIRTRGAHVHRN